MLGSFWQSRRDTSGGDTTPKAPLHSNPDRERNPFETSLNASTSSNSSNTSSSSSSIGLPFVGRHSRKNSAASARDLAGSSGSGGSSTGGLGGNLHGGGLPTGLRTPTLQKSFVLPEVTSSVNATGSHVSGSSSRTAASALHHQPSSSSGRNTPTRTAHSHTPSGPSPNPKEQHHPPPGSPKPGKQPPDFKLSQPPDSKASSKKPGSMLATTADASSKAPTTPSNPSFPAGSNTSSSSSSSNGNASVISPPGASSQQQQQQHATPGSSVASAPTSHRKRENAISSALRGKLTVKIIEARGLITPEANIRPYVVATFEQNEFVSREAINEHEGDATGQPVSPRTSSHLRTSQKNGSAAAGDEMDINTASAYNPIWKHEVAFDVTLDHSPVTVCVYARRQGEEFFLGLVDIKPKLSHGWTLDDWYSLHARQDEDVSGEVHVRMRFERSEVRRTLRSSDFEFLRMIGKGTFGRVFQVRKKDTKRIYAMKVLSKREIIAKKEVQHTIGERKILQRSSECPFLLGLKFSFQSETELFLVMDFKSGGELFYHLQKEGRFTEDRARFYAAEIALAFEYLHKYNIVYRDLKPENILLDATGHIVLADFGLSKPDLPSNALTNTFCGTTEYLAPEVLLDDHGYSQTVDFWSLGVLLFEMCCGWSPFYAEDTQQMYKNICFGKIKFPRGVIGDDGKQFVKGLLNRNPAHRLGSKRDAAELKEHAFFKMIDWDALAARQVAVPFKPYVDSDECVRNFDAEFTDADVLREMPIDNGPYFDDDPATFWVDEPAAGANGGQGGRQGPVPINPSKNRLNGAAPGGLDEEAQDAFRGFSYSGDADLHDLMMSASLQDKDDMRA